jgi:uncharacterized protein YdgA (DUF945 family)
MKKVLLSLVVAAGAVLSAPYFIGENFELEHQALLERLEQNGGQFTLQNSEFERRWFGATASNTLVLPLVDTSLPDVKFTVTEDISFGPILFSPSGIEFGFARSIATIEVDEEFVSKEVASLIKENISIEVLYTLSQDFLTDIQVKKIETTVDSQQVTIEPMTMNYAFVDGKHISGNFHWLGATLADSEVIFTLGELNVDSEQTLIGDDLYSSNALFEGVFSTHMSHMDIVDLQGTPLFSMKALSLKAESKIDNDLMAVNMGYHVDEVISGGENYNKANFSMELNNLKVDVLQQVVALFNELQADPQQVMSPEYSNKLLVLSDKMFAHDPAFKISDLSVETPSGKIISDLNVSIDKAAFDPSNILSLIMALKVDAKGNGPTDFFEKLGLLPFVDMYVQEGFLVKNEKEINFTVNFSAGVLNVNGQPMAL